ncbi:MAG: hypothetical protein AAB393_12200, partial [Bacteroidota bacterium]
TRVFHSASALNPPMGVEVRFFPTTEYFIMGQQHSSREPIPLRIHIPIWKLFQNCATCPIEMAVEATAGVELRSNDIEALFGVGEQMEDGRKFYTVPRVVRSEHGFPMHEDEFVVMTKVQRPMGIPVTREQYLRHFLRKTKADLAEAERQLAQRPTDTADETLRQVRRNMEEAARTMERLDPNAARQMREEMAKTDRETREQMKKDEPAIMAEREEGLGRSRSMIRRVERELAAMTSEERRAPAYILNALPGCKDSANIAAMTYSVECGRPIMFINPAFFDTSAARTAIQLIVMKSLQGGDPTAAQINDPLMFRLRSDIYSTLDWGALTSVLR